MSIAKKEFNPFNTKFIVFLFIGAALKATYTKLFYLKYLRYCQLKRLNLNRFI